MNLLLSIAYEAEAGGRIALLRLPGAGSLEVASLSAGAGVHAGEPTVELRLTGGRLTIDASEGDGFITSVLGDTRVAANFDLAAGCGLRTWGSATRTASLGCLPLRWATPAPGMHGAGSCGLEMQGRTLRWGQVAPSMFSRVCNSGC